MDSSHTVKENSYRKKNAKDPVANKIMTDFNLRIDFKSANGLNVFLKQISSGPLQNCAILYNPTLRIYSETDPYKLSVSPSDTVSLFRFQTNQFIYSSS